MLVKYLLFFFTELIMEWHIICLLIYLLMVCFLVDFKFNESKKFVFFMSPSIHKSKTMLVTKFGFKKFLFNVEQS